MTITDSTLGAVFVGFSFACFVYGILATQVFAYFWRYPLDTRMFKALVAFILLLETADQTFIGHMVYFYTITNFANPIVLVRGKIVWSLILQLVIGALVGAIVKTYFSFRVWRFSNHNIYITGFIILLTISQLVIALVYGVKAFALPNIFAAQDIRVLGSISLGVGVLTDIVTSASLCFYLNRLRTGYTTSDSLINSLSRYAINTGAVTSTVSLATLILYNAAPSKDLYFIATYFTLSKMYAISFMATLNTRRVVRGKGTDQQNVTTNNTNMFHLGTRAPSGNWDKSIITNNDEFPFNSFHPGTKSRQEQLSLK